MKRISFLMIGCSLLFSIVNISSCSSSMKTQIAKEIKQKRQITMPIFQPKKQQRKTSAPQKDIRSRKKQEGSGKTVR